MQFSYFQYFYSAIFSNPFYFSFFHLLSLCLVINLNCTSFWINLKIYFSLIFVHSIFATTCSSFYNIFRKKVEGINYGRGGENDFSDENLLKFFLLIHAQEYFNAKCNSLIYENIYDREKVLHKINK